MVCLDTTFVADLLRGSLQAKSIMESLDRGSSPITIASPSVMELIRGANLRTKAEERGKILTMLRSLIILPLERESAILAGDLESELILGGEVIEPEDVMIAAIAQTHHETLLTRNQKHFARIKDLKIQTY